MPLSRQSLERQLKIAEDTLTLRAKKLQTAGRDGEALKSDSLWRKWNADCQALRRRLQAVAAVEANNAELERRKTEASAAE